MNNTIADVLDFVRENDVKFIRLAFCDICGVQKNISIMPNELERAFETGISFDASAIRGFTNVKQSDLFLRPDPTTLAILPWRPAQGRVIRFFCGIHHPDGSPFESDGRSILKAAVARCAEEGYSIQIGTECEFYLFLTDERGHPTKTPLDFGGYCDVSPLDRAENVRREICLTLEQMGILPESSHHEQGPGQNEIDFRYGDPLTAADNLITFKSVVRAAAGQNGLYASFLPKPLPDVSGSGMHINLSLRKNGENLFRSPGEGHSPEAESFMAGVLDKIREITAFLNPTTNSYKRFGEFEAPKFVTWSHQNRSQLIRIPAASGRYSRMELRSPDACCNPYIAFALLIEAGMRGIHEGIPLAAPTDLDLYDVPDAESHFQALPKTLNEAVALAEGSRFVREVLPAPVWERFLALKREEWQQYYHAKDKSQAEDELYFTMV